MFQFTFNSRLTFGDEIHWGFLLEGRRVQDSIYKPSDQLAIAVVEHSLCESLNCSQSSLLRMLCGSVARRLCAQLVFAKE